MIGGLVGFLPSFGVGVDGTLGEFPESMCTALITKAAHRAGDSEGQALEDGLCLVFLETQYRDLAAKTPKEKMDDIVQKTLRKMSPIAQQHVEALVSAQPSS